MSTMSLLQRVSFVTTMGIALLAAVPAAGSAGTREPKTIDALYRAKYWQAADLVEVLRRTTPLPVTLLPNDFDASIELKGTKKAVNGAIQVLKGIDTKDGPLSRSVQEAYTLAHGASAEIVAADLKNAFSDAKIGMDQSDSHLIVTATLAEQIEIRRLLVGSTALPAMDNKTEIPVATALSLNNTIPDPGSSPGMLGSSSGSAVVNAVATALTTYASLHMALDPNTNTVAIRGSSAAVHAATQLIRALDIEPKEVELDAAIYELTTNELQNIGFNLPANEINTTISEYFPGPNATSTSVPVPVFAAPGKILRAPLSFIAQINTLVSEGKGTAVAYPQLRTLSGRAAYINVGEQIAFSSFQFAASGPSTIGTMNNSVSTGVTLNMTPVAATDGDVSIYIDAALAGFIGYTPQGAPQITTRETKTTLHVHKNEAIIISGMRGETRTVAVGWPRAFQYIPLLKNVFKNKSEDDENTQVFIVIEPHILLSDQLGGHPEVPLDTLDPSFNRAYPTANPAASVSPRPLPTLTPLPTCCK